MLDDIEERGDLLPKSELKGAVTYLRNEWNAVVDIFNYIVAISYQEKLITQPWEGAILYTIALTCRMNKVNLFEYLTDVMHNGN